MQIYTYDTECAKKNGVYIGVAGIIGRALLVLVLLAALIIGGAYADSALKTDWYFVASALALWVAMLIVVIVKCNSKVRARLTSIIVDDNDKIFVLANRKDGSGTMIGSDLAGSVIGEVTNNEALGNAIGTAGMILSFVRLNKSFGIMADREKVTELFDAADKSIMLSKRRIDNINSISETDKYFLINCDITNARTGKAKKNVKMKMYKVYSNMGNPISYIM